jgi:hypothetical protein
VTRREFSPTELKDLVTYYSEAIEFFLDIESGLITVTLTEYKQLSPRFRQCWRHFKVLRNEQPNR